MGDGRSFRCGECGYEFRAYNSIGFMFPEEYQETVAKVRAGEFGVDLKELFHNTSGAAINAERELYVCSSCGGFKNEPNLSVYEPKDIQISKVHTEYFSMANPALNQEYVMPSDLQKVYRLIKAFVHKCPECGKRMHKYTEADRLRCPKCKDRWMDEDGWILWD